MERNDVNLTHRYLREYGIDRGEIVDKAFLHPGVVLY